jgi:hypothetical protein
MRRSFFALISLISLGLLTVAAHGGSLPTGRRFDFGTTKTGGALSYPTGLGSSFAVNGAPITWVQQGPSDKYFGITGGLLTMSTGGCLKGCKFNSKSLGISSFFADGGTVSIYGSLPEFKDDPSGLLFRGVFNSTLGSVLLSHKQCTQTNVTLSNKGGAKSGGLSGCVQVTDINQALLADLNFPSSGGGQGYFSQLFFNLAYTTGIGWSGGIKGTDLNVIPAPEPATLVMFGSALLLAANLLRRKFRSAPSQTAT